MHKVYSIAAVVAGFAVVAAIAYVLWPDTPVEESAVSAAEPALPAAPTAPVSEPTPPEPVQAPAAPDPTAAEPAPVAPPPRVVLPPLDDSDDFVRVQMAEAMNASVRSWLDEEDLVRRFATILDNAAMGDYPRRQLRFIEVPGKFQVIKSGDEIFLDERSYARYDGIVDSFVAITPERTSQLLRMFSPLVTQALAGIGYRGGFEDALAAAADEVLATPELQGAVALVQPKVVYEYRDPDLEALSALQKQVLRMGPSNVGRLKAHVREIVAAMGLSPGKP